MGVTSLCRQLAGVCCVLSVVACGGGGGGGAPASGGGGTTNSAPRFTSATELTFSETEEVRFAAEVTDADGDTVTVTIGNTGDGGLFVLDTASGFISANTPGSLLDFENPQDINTDNVYEQEVSLSDGTATVMQTIRVTITNVDEPPEFSMLGTVPLNENATGPLVTFVAMDPEGAPVTDYTITEVSKLGETVNSDRLLAAFSIDPTTGELTVETAFDADVEGTQDQISVAVSASDGAQTGFGSVSIQLVDLPARVISGVRISGDSVNTPIARSMSQAGDVDGDGSDEILVSEQVDNTLLETAYLIYGSTIRAEMSDGAGDVTIDTLTPQQALVLNNDDRSSVDRQSRLSAAPACDVDGDGTPDLLIVFNEIRTSGIGDAIDGPLAAIVWGDFIATQPDGPLDLTALTEPQGVLIGGLPRRANVDATLVTGDFDGDDSCDLLFGTQSVNAAYIVFGQAITRGADFDIANAGVGEALQLQSNLTQQAIIQQIGGHVASSQGWDSSTTDAVVVSGAGLEPNLEDGVFIVSGDAINSARQVATVFNVSDSTNAAAIVAMSAGADIAIVGVNAGADISGDGIDDLAVAYRGNFQNEKVASVTFSERIIDALANGSDPSLVPASVVDGREVFITGQITSQTIDDPASTSVLVPSFGTNGATWLVGLGGDSALGRNLSGSVFAFASAPLQAQLDPAISFAVDSFSSDFGRQIVGFQPNARVGAQLFSSDIDLDGAADVIFGSEGIGMQDQFGNSGGVLFVPGTVIDAAFAAAEATLDLASSVIGEVP
ncbi:MAG: hypothetical protein AAF004_07555 [Pseudomonadota bacterium]